MVLEWSGRGLRGGGWEGPLGFLFEGDLSSGRVVDKLGRGWVP